MNKLERAFSDYFDGWERYGIKEDDGQIYAYSPNEIHMIKLISNDDLYMGPAEDVRGYYVLHSNLKENDLAAHREGADWKPGRMVIKDAKGGYHVWVGYEHEMNPGSNRAENGHWYKMSEGDRVVHCDAEKNEVVSKALDKQKRFSDIVAENLVAQLEAGAAPWQKHWDNGNYLPVNPVTGKRYKGINAIHLLGQGRNDPRWMTYNQAKAIGAQVRRGEKGTAIQFWRFSEGSPKLDINGKPEVDGSGQPVTEKVALERPQSFLCVVFNAEQIEGLAPLEAETNELGAVERAEKILNASGARIQHVEGNKRSYYVYSHDTIYLPAKEQFNEPESYCSAAFQALAHWTGYDTRLNRDVSNPFGSESYAKQELVADIAALFLGAEIGIGYDPEQYGKYLDAWLQIIKDDPLEIFRAASDAEKIIDYVLAFEQRREHKVDKYVSNFAHIEGKTGVHKDLLFDVVFTVNGEQHQHAISLDLIASLKSSEEIFREYEPTYLDDILISHIKSINASVTSLMRHKYGKDYSGLTSVAVSLRKEPFVSDCIDIVKTSELNVWRDENTQRTLGDEIKTEIGYRGDIRHKPETPLLDGSIIMEGAIRDEIDAKIFSASICEDAVIEVNKKFAKLINKLNERIEQRDDTKVHLNEYEAELSRLLELSTLAPAEYTPSNDVKSGLHAAVFFDGQPIILCGSADDTESVIKSDDLARSPATSSILKAAGLDGTVYSSLVRGDSIIWPQSVASIASKPSGEITKAGDSGSLISIVLSDAGSAIATALCINTDTARILDKDAPLLDDGVHLTALAKAAGVHTEPSRKVLEKHYLNVPYSDKEEAKALGARWDAQKRSWYVYEGIKDIKMFSKWEAQNQKKNKLSGQNRAERIYLSVPWSERLAAKKHGAIWDPRASSWYAGPKAHLQNLSRWLPENTEKQQSPAMSPKEEFTEALKSLGCVVSGEHPIMDGKTHRIKCENDKTGEMAGFYIGHLDGRPAGYIKNNRTGVEMRWKSKGYNLSPKQKAELRAEAANKLALRAAEQKRDQEDAAMRVNNQIKGLKPIVNPTPYLLNKGVNPASLEGILTDKYGKKTYIPIFDSDGRIRSMQYIQADGTKRFAKNSRTEGCFHPIGGMSALEKAAVLVLAEGYATAASLSEALGQSVVVVSCFNSGNMVHVAKELNAKYPDKPFVIAGDDDRFLEMTKGENPGRKKAEEAAALVGGKAVFPIFDKRENYPMGLAPITPLDYKRHLNAVERLKQDPSQNKKYEKYLIDPPKLSALKKIKLFTDFNDLATKSKLGAHAVLRQVSPEVNKNLKIAKTHKPLNKRRHHALSL